MVATRSVPVSGQRSLFCTFRLAERLFGFNILDVKEVTTETTFTRVPQAPSEVLGYVNLRGQIHLVLDLRRMLDLPPVPITRDSRLVLFKPSVGDAFGVLVDRIGDIVELREEQLEPWRGGDAWMVEGMRTRVESHRPGGWVGDLIQAIGKLETELLIVLDAKLLLRAIEFAMERPDPSR